MRRIALLGLVLAAAAVVSTALARPGAGAGMDWPRFGYDAARHNAAPGSGLTAANVGKLERLSVTLDGTVIPRRSTCTP